jgi:subtilase family serine protease
LLACADDTLVVPEANESNNCMASGTRVTLSGPDLITTSVSNPPTTITPGSTFAVTDTVQNIATMSAAASTTRYYLSSKTSKGGGHLLTGSRAVPSLAPNATSSGTVTVTASTGTPGGTYFLLACADDTVVVPETNESNNCLASATQVTLSGPDLITTSVSNPPTTITSGGTFSVTDTVQNTGSATAAASTARYYLSPSNSRSGGHLLTGTRAVPSLTPSTTSNGTVTVTVSAGTPAGTYFLLACADDAFVVPELNESNNCLASAAQVSLSGPDLVATAVSNPPTTLILGGTFSVTDTVENIGSATAASSTTRYYFSTTTSKSGGHLLTGSRAVPLLAPNSAPSGTATVTVTAGTPAGTYFLLACADDTLVVPEVNESNNCLASAAQVTVSGPDLIQTSVSDPPSTLTPGSTFSAADTVQNTGSATAAASTTRFYLSTTASKSGSILLSGTRSVASLAPTATSSGNTTVTIPSNLPSGTYFLLACSDDTKVVSETNENNNCMASAATATH